MPEWISRYWVEWVFGLLIAVLTWVVRTLSSRLKQYQTENTALRDGMKALLKAQIIDKCERAQRDGWCGAQYRDSISDLYNSYHALGGNGVVTGIVKKTMELPAVAGEGGNHD
jgi:hypothetical protein